MSITKKIANERVATRLEALRGLTKEEIDQVAGGGFENTESTMSYVVGLTIVSDELVDDSKQTY